VEHDREGPIRIVVAQLAADHIRRDGQQTASAPRPSTRPSSSGQPPFGHVVLLNTALNDFALPISTTGDDTGDLNRELGRLAMPPSVAVCASFSAEVFACQLVVRWCEAN